MMRPTVTVLIDTYNHERFIEEAIVSVLEQDFPREETEVIVVDDGSTDRTPEIIRKFAPRVRHLRKANGGQASAFNAGIAEAIGDYVAFLDGDDWWAQDKLQWVCNTFESNPEIGVVGHGYVEVYENESVCRTFVPDSCYHIHLRNEEGARLLTMLKSFLGTSRVAIRKKVLDQVLPIPDELVIEADEFMSTMAVALSDGIILDKPLFYYRFHADNLFQFRERTREKLLRRQKVMACLAAKLPNQLATVGCSPRTIARVIEPIWVEAERGRLALEGGKPRDTYRIEKTDFRLSYKRPKLGYRIFKATVLMATLLLPPRSFYRIRQWYSDNNLKRIRRLLGEPEPAAPIVERS